MEAHGMNTTAQKTIRLLIVEDDEGDAEYLRWALRDLPGHRFEVEWSQRLAGGLLMLSRNSVDVVLLDLNLPDSTGLKTLDQVHASSPRVPIVVLTGLNDEEAAVTALRHGAQDYLIKGQIDNSTLGRVIRYAIGRKQVEEELLRSQEQLRRVQKMEAVGRLAGGIAHDFNNMLTSILGFARFVDTQIAEDHPARADISQILYAAKRAASLTRQLLALGPHAATRLTTFDINRIVRATHGLLRRTLNENIEIVTVLGENMQSIRADASQVEQVLMNLSLNARDAMPDGGTLTIRTERVMLDEAARKSRPGLHPGPHVLLVVTDTGCGMSDDVRDRAFEPFFTTKDRDKGSGLGLATAYGVVTQFGGHIELDTAVGSGTEFRVYFPAVDDLEDDLTTDVAGQSPTGTETILLVEDEDTVRLLTKRMLQDLGYTVLEARHGGMARELFNHANSTIHLIISDVVMPHVDGPHLLRELRQTGKTFKTLYMSGYTDGRIDEDDTPVLPKPFTKEELATIVRAVLDGKPVSARDNEFD
jgi:signal transduction histidine kinase